jgi:type I restriction enzyme R subunit
MKWTSWPRTKKKAPGRLKSKSKWAALEKVVGANPAWPAWPLTWWPTLRRATAQDGKAMVVAMSREICVHLYDEIVKLRPDWHSETPSRAPSRL